MPANAQTIVVAVPILPEKTEKTEKGLAWKTWGALLGEWGRLPLNGLIMSIRRKGTGGPPAIELLLNETRHYLGQLPFEADPKSVEAGARPIPIHERDLVEIRSAKPGYIELTVELGAA